MIKRFTVYRRGDLSETHGPDLQNAPDEPQFEGVIFTDGTCAVRWLTAKKSTSVWASLDDLLAVHGHPEERYGTYIEWHDGATSVGAKSESNDLQLARWRAGFTLYPEDRLGFIPDSMSHLKGSQAAPGLLKSLNYILDKYDELNH